LKEITLGTKEKQLLQGRRYANQHQSYSMFGVQVSFLGTAIGLFWQNTSCILKKNYFSQIRKATQFVVLGHI
jgi:hypothetical protein